MESVEDNLPPISFGAQGLNLQPAVVGGLRGALAEISEKDSGKLCRICLEDEDPNDNGLNPFITPCNCVGSVKFIHVSCVREWLDAKK